jgi:hypothetical protein
MAIRKSRASPGGIAIEPSSNFDTRHDEAFSKLGALRPGRHWSAFDVPRSLARNGQATRFVTTIWNYHSEAEKRGRRTAEKPAISKDEDSGTFWYQVGKPTLGERRTTWVAHWKGLELALASRVPIIGMLKDVSTGLCSLSNLFDCDNPQYGPGGDAWLQLHPRGEVACKTRPVDIFRVTGYRAGKPTREELERRFENDVAESLRSTPQDRLARLKTCAEGPTQNRSVDHRI